MILSTLLTIILQIHLLQQRSVKIMHTDEARALSH